MVREEGEEQYGRVSTQITLYPLNFSKSSFYWLYNNYVCATKGIILLGPTSKFRFFITYLLSLDHSKTVFFYDKIVANDG